MTILRMKRGLVRIVLLCGCMLAGGMGISCGGGGGASSAAPDSGADSGGTPLETGMHTYTLTESTGSLLLWTAPCAHKVRHTDGAPSGRSSGLHLHAARNEFEPFQLIVSPASGTLSVSMEDFPGLGTGQRLSLATGAYASGWMEYLHPLAPDTDIPLKKDEPTVLWGTVYIPPDAAAGDHVATLTLRSGDGEIRVPVRLTVFDFTLPAETHFATQMNLDVRSLIPAGGNEEAAKTLLFEHRMTPKSVTWPSGFNWNITWDNPRSRTRCTAFWDEPDEPEAYSIGALSQKYILGEGWNGVGFPNAMAFQFVNNSTPRPDTLCGVPRGDAYGSPAYNATWQAYLSALESYLKSHGMGEKAYYYVQNEPQDEEDYRLAIHLNRLARKAAPDLRIAISEEPKPEIAECGGDNCGYDIWIAHIRHYQQEYAWKRQRDHGEEVWFYSLDQDPDPYFNPTRVDIQGMHQRIIPWAAWRYRVRGWAYYDATRFFEGPYPTYRAAMLREGFEDYEYLYLANGKAHPAPYLSHEVDVTVSSVAASLTSWTRNPDALMSLRQELGRYIEGSRTTAPALAMDTHARPRAAYHINFQDPGGKPADNPLILGGDTWLKIGWAPYNETDQYGWYGEYVGNGAITRYGYDERAGYSEVQRSYLYDDYGRDNLFEFALENGRYEVTVGAGRPARGYPADPHRVRIEGLDVIDNEITSDARPTLERTVTVDLRDGRLSLEMGGRSALTGKWSYTFLAYLIIRPVD